MNKLLKTLALATASSTAFATAALAEVRTERVTFQSGGQTLVGTLYIPDGVSARNQAPGVVVTGAWMTIKEQMPAVYARELAQRGIVALAFDFRTWGESGGAQRSMEDPAMKIADIKAAASFLDRRAETAGGQIAGLGICASAGYMVHAAADSRVIRSVALVAPWLHNAATVNMVYGAENVSNLTKLAVDAQAKFDANSTLTLQPAAGPQGSNAVMAGVPYYTETDRGAIPQWENTFNVASWDDWLNFDAQAAAPKLTDAFLMVHSEAAAIPQGARQFFANLTGPKEQIWLDGVSQFDFYDRSAPVTAASDAVARHFKSTL
jgi:dienelactone hydrolase